MAQSVHFRDIESTVAAVKSTGYEAWSVWEKNLLLCKGTNTEDLETFLQLLSDSATNAIYTVRYYGKITDKDLIKNTTPHDGAFNFRMNSEGQEVTQSQYGVIRHGNETLSRIAGLEEKFDKLLLQMEDDNNEDQEKPNSLGIIGEIISHPIISPMIPQILSALLGNGMTTPGQFQQRPALMQPQTVGNVPDEKQKLETAIRKLQQYDPRITDHLTKLANIAEKDPATFTMILASLDGYLIQ